MADNFNRKLLGARLGLSRSHRSVQTLYGDKSWAEDLDIVNELGGHTGCVNALSWSTSGRLLASGSDDTHLNIWEYMPSDLAKPFTLNTSVSTGHHANIFSVKFMPHSGDHTVVTCAGDSEVRVFDLEYSASSGNANTGSAFTSSTRSRRFNDFFRHARWLNDSNTNARVYRSHADRAKRVVTESSPHLFLTCSEDGEVRQWDLRLPSSAYPAPRNGRGYHRFQRMTQEGSDNVPPPLISYKKYALDLNSISCASSQPHYIALGGAHLHCFLHDRRMLGRDLSDEAGRPAGKMPQPGTLEDESLGNATRCVKRFAPNEKRRMSTHDHGHITACKISDAHPNEMVVSWSGDHIYSFDLIQSPDAREKDAQTDQAFQAHRLKNRADRKRKRKAATVSSGSLAAEAPSTQVRRVADEQQENGTAALRVRYEDGETEMIAVDPSSNVNDETDTADIQDSLIGQAQLLAERIARGLVQLRKTLFDFSEAVGNTLAASMETSDELTPYTIAFTATLGQCCHLLPQMNDIISEWSYPVDPSEDEVLHQNSLRKNRQASWRFVQAAGCLARVLGGRLQTLSSGPDPRLTLFQRIKPAVHESRRITKESQFCYDFLKAILLWLEGGQDVVLKSFIRPAAVPIDSPRYPLREGDDVDTSLAKLQQYLTDLASDETPIINLDSNRFETNDNRQVFPSQRAAVLAFCRALGGIELQDQYGQSAVSSTNPTKRVMDKGAAMRFWGVKVGRSLLMQAATGVTFDSTLRAFGGLRIHIESEEPDSLLDEIDPEGSERVVEDIDLISTTGDTATTTTTSGGARQVETTQDTSNATVNEEEDDDDENDQDQDGGSEVEESESEEDEPTRTLFRRRAGFGRSRERASVNIDVPYSSHARVYKGHCNTRTVKDVNFYGLDDEYVVSGSDDGHFFIWDRKTTKIVNILKGDGEVVNVVQGHPYEPMIACSGIDSTVKIFGAGGESRERHNAARGVDIANPGGSVHSSLRYGGRPRRPRDPADDDDDNDVDNPAEDGGSADEAEAVASGRGLPSRRALQDQYRITSSNDEDRRAGVGDAFITEGMLARLAAALQRGQLQGVVGGQVGAGGEGRPVVINEDCLVM